MSTVLVKTCPGGHTLPLDHFHSCLDFEEPDLMEAITFDCDGGKRGHKFTLQKAVDAGMFTTEEAEKIKEQARFHIQEFGPK